MTNPHVVGVHGEIAAAMLGVTLMHEHLLLDARRSWHEPGESERISIAHQPVSCSILHELRNDPFMNYDNCSLFNIETAIEESLQFRDLGGRTIVDCTCANIGRDPYGLQKIANRTGLQIIMGSGYYLEKTHPSHIDSATIEAIEAEIRSDLLDGVGNTGIRAGFIGEIGISENFTTNEEKVLRAAARAQQAAGVMLSVHLPGWHRHGHRVLDVIEEEGGMLSRTVLDHMNPSGFDQAYQIGLAERGAYLEYDMIGMDYFFADQEAQCTSPAEDANAIVGLINAGFLNHILLSQDVFLKTMLTEFGGNGYAYILRHFVPRLRRHGVREEAITRMLVDNPRAVLTGDVI